MLFLLEEIVAIKGGIEEKILNKYLRFVGTRILLTVKSKRKHSDRVYVGDRLVIYIS